MRGMEQNNKELGFLELGRNNAAVLPRDMLTTWAAIAMLLAVFADAFKTLSAAFSAAIVFR